MTLALHFLVRLHRPQFRGGKRENEGVGKGEEEEEWKTRQSSVVGLTDGGAEMNMFQSNRNLDCHSRESREGEN